MPGTRKPDHLPIMEYTRTDSVQLLRWSIVAGLDTLFELIIVVLSVVLVWPLQMPLDIKLTVVLAFFFRIL